MNTLSTHVLDTSLGRPAAGIRVTLERLGDANQQAPAQATPSKLATGTTDSNGRVTDLLGPDVAFADSVYRLRFDVAEYFARTGREVFFPEVVIHFVVRPGEEHYHIPLLLSPFGFTTYRGS